jgi:ABC-type sugar transport system substrate-binding protein
MKKNLTILSVIAIAAMLLAACASAPVAEEAAPAAEEAAPAEEAAAEAVLVGYGAPELSGAQGQIMQGLIDHAEAKGWEVVTTNADFDAEAQANQMDDFISQGVNAIVTVPVDSQAICSSVAKAQEAGIAFYTIDRAPIGCAVDMTVQSDNYLAGKQSAEATVAFLTEKYGEAKGTVLELQGDLGQNVAQLRGGGFNDYMADYPNITIISKPTEWDAAKFSSATLDVAGSTEIDAIYMHSDSVGTTVVLAALEQLGKIYRGEITNWKDVGGTDADIVILSRDSSSGTYEFFKEAVVGKDLEYAKEAKLLASTQAIVQETKDNPNAIGYIGLGYVTPDVKVVKIDGIAASIETALDGSYVLSRGLYMYSNGAPSGVMSAYIDFILSPEGQAVVADQGFVPLSQ